MAKVLFDETSEFAHYRVVEQIYDGRPARILYGDNKSPQSGLALDDNPELIFDYNQRFLEITLSVSPKRTLVIGGGGFTLPSALLRRFPWLKLDVVEIDPALPHIARDYFELPDTRRLRIFSEDGRQFLERTRTKYDLIILDAFSSYVIPKQLLTLEAVDAYKKHLARGGILAINFIAGYSDGRLSLTQEILATFGQRFPALELYRADRGLPIGIEQNLVLVAGNKIPSLDYLQSSLVPLYPIMPGAITHDE